MSSGWQELGRLIVDCATVTQANLATVNSRGSHRGEAGRPRKVTSAMGRAGGRGAWTLIVRPNQVRMR